MPILPNAQQPRAIKPDPAAEAAAQGTNAAGTTTSSASGGSPRGWSFISAASCWRAWAFKYVFGLQSTAPADPTDPLLTGSAYHAFMEGMAPSQVAKLYPAFAAEGQRLAGIRRLQGPPLPPAATIEETTYIFDGKMTSKPDRTELVGGKRRMRDFKTAMVLSEKDQNYWETDGGILGQAIATKCDEAVVDIVRKTPGTPQVKLVKVHLTPEKEEALAAHVADFWDQVEYRVERAALAINNAKKPRLVEEPVPVTTTFNYAFPPNLKACAGHKYECRYYNRCWGTMPENLQFKLAKEPPQEWRKGCSKSLLTKLNTIYKAWSKQVAVGLNVKGK